jgi:hypothetical protein
LTTPLVLGMTFVIEVFVYPEKLAGTPDLGDDIAKTLLRGSLPQSSH